MERVAKCLRALVPGRELVDVLKVAGREGACYAGLQVCGSVWLCPVCAAKVTERRRVELGAGVARWKEQGGLVVLATYTVRHWLGDCLSCVVDGVLEARNKLRSGKANGLFRKRYGVAGSVRSLEVTLGDRNGWHPHIHELLFLEPESDYRGLQGELLERWGQAVQAAGLRDVNEHGVDVRDTWGAVGDYLAKLGEEPELPSCWGPEHEVTKAPSKRGRLGGRTPLELLADYTFYLDQTAARRWQEYAGVFKERRQLVWSHGLRKLLGLGVEKADEEVATEISASAVLLAQLTRAQWRVVLANEARGELLNEAATGDPERVWQFLRELGAPV